MCSIVVVDDQVEFIEAARRLVDGQRGLQVIGAATTAAEALDLIARVQPRLVLIDVNLPDASGFELALRVAAQVPGARLVMMSVLSDPQYEAVAQAVGAVAFLPKTRLTAEWIASMLSPLTGSPTPPTTGHPDRCTGPRTAGEPAPPS